ncbi:unnamed protein product [Bemisia tabaci]|uniref:C2H2-type domain-containing protein n=1 Tax=Bemisia tabaci TaxID=7038 RepID=A0A9P0AP72_BEMTA|nr:unnamed protein product [Bemisia tabaci]
MLFKGNSSKLEHLIEKIQANKENHELTHQLDLKDALGTEPGSSWGSETSPGSSCATPNSAAESDVTFTVGVTDATPYACQFCEKAFPRLSYLKKHEQTHSEHMPFRCEFCSRLFKHKRSRDRHIKLHTGDKKYRCTQCEAAFSRSDHLKIHMKTHDNQKPFQCTVCNRGYNTAAALTSHMQNHKRSPTPNNNNAAPGSSYRCLQCSELFRKPEQLQNHMSTAHKMEPPTTGARSGSRGGSPYTSASRPRLACIYCTNDNFTTMEALQLHVQAMHGSILNGDLHRELSQQQLSLPSPGQHFMSSLSLGSPGSATRNSALLPLTCELCTMRFGSVQALHKHAVFVHGYRGALNGKDPGPAPEPLFCVRCALPFPSPASFAEHFVLVHGSSAANLLGIPSPVQLKPTDLSVTKKSGKHASSSPGEDDRPPSGKKAKIGQENGVSPNGPLPRSLSRTPTNHYDEPGTLMCNQCNAALPNFESFRSHVKAHIEEAGGLRGLLGGATNLERKLKSLPPEHPCPHCGATFSSPENQAQHLLTHFLSTTTEYGCQSCGKAFGKPDELQRHLLDAHTHHLYRCALCKEIFDSKVTIQVHFAVNHSKECKLFRCTGCPSSVATYRSEMDFNSHVRTVHTPHSMNLLSSPKPIIQSPQLLQCFFCRLSFASEIELQFHLAVHTKQFQCPVCPEAFHVEFLLDKHMETVHHSSQVVNGGDQRQCSTPKSSKTPTASTPTSRNSSTPQPNNLPTSRTPNGYPSHPSKKSESNHNIPSNSCDICECANFTSEAELTAHRKLVHNVKSANSGKVSLHCAYCNENFKTRTELENHMKSHSQSSGGSGKHKCNICDEICPSAAVLAEHKLTHCKVISGSACTHCKTTLGDEEEFMQHLQQHSSTNPGLQQQQQLVLPTACVICRQTLVSEMEARIHARFHLHRGQSEASTSTCCVCLQPCDRRDLNVGICSECLRKQSSKASIVRCPECQITFDGPLALEAHLASAHRKNYQCIKCQISLETEQEMQLHVASHMLSDGLSGLECRLCLRVLGSPLQLQTHLIEHTFAGCPAFTCYICSSVFTAAAGLQSHILEHGLAARPYDCPRCSSRFFFRAELDNHSFIHLEEDAIGADLTKNLSYHYQNRFSPKTPSKAALNSSFSEFDQNKNCRKQPSNERSGFVCQECQKEFDTEDTLEAHSKTCRARITPTEDAKEEISEDPMEETEEKCQDLSINSRESQSPSKSDDVPSIKNEAASPRIKEEMTDDNEKEIDVGENSDDTVP